MRIIKITSEALSKFVQSYHQQRVNNIATLSNHTIVTAKPIFLKKVFVMFRSIWFYYVFNLASV